MMRDKVRAFHMFLLLLWESWFHRKGRGKFRASPSYLFLAETTKEKTLGQVINWKRKILPAPSKKKTRYYQMQCRPVPFEKGLDGGEEMLLQKN